MSLPTEILGLIETIVSIIAVVIYIFLIYLLSKTRLLHTAFRTAARIYSLAVILYMLARIISIADAQFHVISQFDPSLIGLPYRITIIFSYSFWLGLSFITIERAIASHFVSSYEDKFNSAQAHFLLIALYIALDIVQNVCRVLYPNPTTIVVCFINTVVNLGVMYYIKWKNKRRNTLERDLSYRYQVKENVLISSAILPLTYISCAFTFSLFPFLYLMKKVSDPDTRGLYAGIFFLITAFLPPTYALGLLMSSAFRRVLISQGFVKEEQNTTSEVKQYELTWSAQDTLWKVQR